MLVTGAVWCGGVVVWAKWQDVEVRGFWKTVTLQQTLLKRK